MSTVPEMNIVLSGAAQQQLKTPIVERLTRKTDTARLSNFKCLKMASQG